MARCQVCRCHVKDDDVHNPHDLDCENHEGCSCDNTTCPDCCWECEPLQHEGGETSDYKLAGKECWITVGDLSIHIASDEGSGVNVEVYELNNENAEPISSLWAHRNGKDWDVP